eukprot:4283078-Pleurochrysis_carterae.AAC.1
MEQALSAQRDALNKSRASLRIAELKRSQAFADTIAQRQTAARLKEDLQKVTDEKRHILQEELKKTVSRATELEGALKSAQAELKSATAAHEGMQKEIDTVRKALTAELNTAESDRRYADGIAQLSRAISRARNRARNAGAAKTAIKNVTKRAVSLKRDLDAAQREL